MLKQPPSGGCVLKHCYITNIIKFHFAAAFGRLCVETKPSERKIFLKFAAAFGRLCVETPFKRWLLWS